MSLPRTGPVRSEAARIAILDATAALFAERGYEHLTIEGVAARAGVGKQTIYRWWRSKGALVAECLLEGLLFDDRLALPDTGDVRADMQAWLTTVFAVIDAEPGLVLSLLAAAAEHPEVGARLRDSLTGSASISGRLDAAIGTTTGLRPGVATEQLAEALIGAVVLRALSRTSSTADDAARLVDLLIGRASDDAVSPS
ncbi:TetR/AcrR family transcriptional regulator [Agrococcus sp. Marseille-Q4369]|uniref:TetR/AcrR family transcriptional regulator n=1 Tax=Agrococcus sp. Marseille-Q4369 TaxID=2810513 RepID=UPI001B8CEE4A|nr:TetR/AcrR family transcriptional regulator [Agrococcus sp. Marseille-Q4369]QUW19485.1 TetR/AcrR family transcriptional regulator [Agrococcus sp. Marseille-Q4369]